jgi:putative tricarboxylic transport membrane protein
MEIKCRSNLIGGLASLILGIVILLIIPSQVALTNSSSKELINQQFFPGFSAILMSVMGLVLIVQSLVFKKDKIITISIKDEMRMLLYFAVIITVVIFMKFTGFLIASCLITIFSFAYFRCKKISYYVWSLIFVTMVYFLFKVALRIPLP